MRRFGAAICIVLLLGAAGAIALKWHGPIVLSLSASHGIDAADLLAFPLVALAISVARRRWSWRAPQTTGWPGRWAASASALGLGALLLLAGVGTDARGGPLVPGAGGTFDGTGRMTFGASRLPVDHWSDVALTYDGAALRLYVNGSQVSSRAATGRIQALGNPLWIGGNRPFGEHFDGLIDEVRVYDRALSRAEIRADMAMPVAPAPGLVAAYGFDAGSGARAADSSGEGNAGVIHGATWARGRYGDALRFDGATTVVRVPTSASLTLAKGVTLSGWVRPSEAQTGWRTIVQRQTAEYYLAASSDAQDRQGGLIDDVRAALIAVAAVWFCVVTVTARDPWTAAQRRSWWLPVALFVVGSLGDALAPTPTLTGPALVGLWLAATSSSVGELASFLTSAAVCIALTIASLFHIGGVDLVLFRHSGGVARTAAFGALFVLGGLATRLRRIERVSATAS